MATWVEGKPITPQNNTLSDGSDITTEPMTPWTRMSPLSDASNKALESTTSTSHIFHDDKLNYNLGSVTKTLRTPKPKVSPRQFSSAVSSVPFSALWVTQAPLAAPEPWSVTSEGIPSGKVDTDIDDKEESFRHMEGKHALTGAGMLVLSPALNSSLGAEGLRRIRADNTQDDENVPDLPSKPKICNIAVSTSNAVLNPERMIEEEREYTVAKPTSMVILETSIQKLKSMKTSDVRKWTNMDISQNQEKQRTNKSFALPKSSSHFKMSSSSALEGIETSSLTSLDLLGKSENPAEEDKSKTDKGIDIAEGSLCLRDHGRRKSRPLAAWLSGTTRDENLVATIKYDENISTPEKPWRKNPRPLSMDLTARFERAGSMIYKRNNCPSEESKENVPVMPATGALFSGTEHKARVQPDGSAVETEKSGSPDDCVNKGRSYLSDAKEKGHSIPKLDTSKKDHIIPKLYKTDNKEKFMSSSESKILEQNHCCDNKMIAEARKEEKEERTITTSFKTESHPEQHKKWTNRELDKSSSHLELSSNDENSHLDSDDQRCKGNRTPVAGGIIKKRISLLLDSASSTTAKSDSPQATVEKEKINICVKQQIQSFTSEKKEELSSSQRCKFRPRPLSSEITKLFETRAAGDENRFEKLADLSVFSSPEHSILWNFQQQRGSENIEKGNEVDRELVEKGHLRMMETDTEFLWSRDKSVKKVSKALDKETIDEKISRRESFVRKKEMKSQVNETKVPRGVASLSKVGSCSSEGQESVPEPLDCHSLVKPVRVVIVENDPQCHKVPELVKLEGFSDSVNTCFDEEKMSVSTSQSSLKSYTAMKMHNEQDSKETKPFQLEATSSIGKEKIYFETEQSDFRQSSKMTEQNVSSSLVPARDAKVGCSPKVSKKATSPSLPTSSEDKIGTGSMRKSHLVTDQEKLEENVGNLRRRWNRPHPSLNSSLLETPSMAPNSEINVEMLNAIHIQHSPERMLNSAVMASDKFRKKQLKVSRHSSFTNTDVLVSKGSSRYIDLRKSVDSTTRELLPSAGTRDVKHQKSKDDTEAGKATRLWLQDGATSEFFWKAYPKAGRVEKSQKASLAADQVFDFSPEVSYKKHSYTCVSADRRSDSFSEVDSEDDPRNSSPEKPKSTLLSEEFLSKPWTNGKDEASEKTHVTPPVKMSKTADIEQSRKTRSSLQHKSHNVLDLDALMAEYRKENSERKHEESKMSHYLDKKDSDHTKTLQKDDDEHSIPKLPKSANPDFGKASPSGKRRSTSDKLIKKPLHRNSILDLDALMADYTKESSTPADVLQKLSGSKPISGTDPDVKIQQALSPFSEEVKTSQRNEQRKKGHDGESARDVFDGTDTDLKRRTKEEKRESRPSSVYCEYDLRKNEVCSTRQKLEVEQRREMDGNTTPVANVIRRPKREQRKSRPSSAYAGCCELQQPELLGRDRGTPRKDDQWELMPSSRKDRIVEGRSVTPVQVDNSNRALGDHDLDAKNSTLDYLVNLRRPLYAGSHTVLEKERCVEMPVDDVQHTDMESRPAGYREHSDQNYSRTLKDCPKDDHLSDPEIKKSRHFEIYKAHNKMESLSMNQESSSADSKNHKGRRRSSLDWFQRHGMEISKHGLPSTMEDKMDSQQVQKEQGVEFRKSMRRKIGDMIQLPSKTKKQSQKKTLLRHEVQQQKCQVHKADRVTQCCTSPTIKAKDTDVLVQEKGQFYACEDNYGTCEERGSGTYDEAEPCNENNEPKVCRDTICSPVSTYKDFSIDPVVWPRSKSLSPQSVATHASEQPCPLQEPRSASCEMESTDGTDSSQSTGPVTHHDQTSHGFSFLEPVTTLDSGAQKCRIQLGRKTFRRAPTKHRKGGLGDQSDGTDQWLERSMEPYMYKDSTEPIGQEELTTEKIKGYEKLLPSQSQKVAMFPGMDPAVLKASLRRTRPESEVMNELNSKSSKPPSQQDVKVLSPTNGKEGSEITTPPWLQEIKLRKRFSQFQPCSEDQ
ncbi:uncharacterized protein KIAA1671-like [Narcine bancroftii]|uniref:uncharacterized protein KIAA1671-like n=1 Tax=Narcine bancroftii TaxID=1343680 RepID=UPI003832054F